MKGRKAMPTMFIVLPLTACLVAACLRVSAAQPPQQTQPQQVQPQQVPLPARQQQPPQFQPGQPQFQPGQPPFQPGPRMPWFGAALPVAIYANDKYVYVVRGNVLYQFDAETLQLKNRVILQDVVPPPPPQPAPAPQQLQQPIAQPRQ